MANRAQRAPMMTVLTLAARTLRTAGLAGAVLAGGLSAAQAESAPDLQVAQTDVGREPLQIENARPQRVVDVERGVAYETAYGAFQLAPNTEIWQRPDGSTAATGLGLTASWRTQWQALGRGFDFQLAQNNRVPLATPGETGHGVSASGSVRRPTRQRRSGSTERSGVGRRCRRW